MSTAEGFRLDGRVALITGSGRDIGRAIAERFAVAGAKVVMYGLATAISADTIAVHTLSPGPIDTVQDWSRYVRQKPEDVIAGARMY